MLLEEKELITGLQNGNEQVFETMFRKYYERLCNYANTFLDDIDEAEETVQKTFLMIWEKRTGIAIHTSLKSYLYRAVHNNCLNLLKHIKVKHEHRREVGHTGNKGHDEVTEGIIGVELEQQIQKVIANMPEKCAMVFKMSRFENLTYAEIAGQLNISYKTVDNHMVRALRILRENLKEYLPLLLWFLFKN
ncbi:MAG: RNA polymerase sigma-70 factor [Bacteroidota bacterium]